METNADLIQKLADEVLAAIPAKGTDGKLAIPDAGDQWHIAHFIVNSDWLKKLMGRNAPLFPKQDPVTESFRVGYLTRLNPQTLATRTAFVTGRHPHDAGVFLAVDRETKEKIQLHRVITSTNSWRWEKI